MGFSLALGDFLGGAAQGLQQYNAREQQAKLDNDRLQKQYDLEKLRDEAKAKNDERIQAMVGQNQALTLKMQSDENQRKEKAAADLAERKQRNMLEGKKYEYGERRKIAEIGAGARKYAADKSYGARVDAAKQKASSAPQVGYELFGLPDGSQIFIKKGDAVPKGARKVAATKPIEIDTNSDPLGLR